MTLLPGSEKAPINVIVPSKTVNFSPSFGCKRPPESFSANFHASKINNCYNRQFFWEILGSVPKVDDDASLNVSFETLSESYPQWEQGYDIEYDPEGLIFRFHLLWNIIFALIAIHEEISSICSIYESPRHTRDQIGKKEVFESNLAKRSSKYIKKCFGNLEACPSFTTWKTTLETK